MAVDDPGVRHSWAPVLYATYFGILTKKANELGYALTIHGSMGRDFDLVAVPWVEGCGSHRDLIEAFVGVVGYGGDSSLTWDGPESKPHGRVAYTISAGAGMYFDVSITSMENRE